MKETFIKVVETLSDYYPKRQIKMNGTLVEIDGETKFNTDGFVLLYNLQRLCDELKDELR